MDIEIICAKMTAQLAQARQSSMSETFGWEFEIDPIIYVIMRPRQKPDRINLLRVSFSGFPKRAPSYLFVDRETKQTTRECWPPNVGHGDPPTGICTPGTREFHERLHLNDTQYPWDPERYTFLQTLQEIHRMMERGIG